MRNSTIRIRQGKCAHAGCAYYGPLTKGLCQNHYWQQIKMKSVAKLEERDIQNSEGLSTVIDDLDLMFSQWVRLKASDENGYCVCYGCSAVHYWTDMQAVHYISRSHMNTRFSDINVFCGCVSCNKNEGGKLSSYSTHFGNLIERDRPGGVGFLEEQGAMRYDYSISELKGLISHYSKKVKELKKKIPLKI